MLCCVRCEQSRPEQRAGPQDMARPHMRDGMGMLLTVCVVGKPLPRATLPPLPAPFMGRLRADHAPREAALSPLTALTPTAVCRVTHSRVCARCAPKKHCRVLAQHPTETETSHPAKKQRSRNTQRIPRVPCSPCSSCAPPLHRRTLRLATPPHAPRGGCQLPGPWQTYSAHTQHPLALGLLGQAQERQAPPPLSAAACRHGMG